MKYPWQWDITDLENLIGQSESLRLEFKDARLLDLNQKKNSVNKVTLELSKEVSAFANSEGGTLVVGIEEDKTSKPRIALQIAGVDINYWNPERLQQILDSNISPPLPGIRVKPIYLDEEKTICVYVIYIPAGTTAYQAKDYVYYGRSEFESKALPDHEIRMRMFRGKIPNATILMKNAILREIESNPMLVESNPVEPKDLNSPQYLHVINLQEDQEPIVNKEYSFDIYLNNIGETNIRELKCKIAFSYSNLLKNRLDYMSEGGEFSFKDGWQVAKEIPSIKRGGDPIIKMDEMKINIYPDDLFFISEFFCSVKFTKSNESLFLSEGDLILNWTLYLEDRLPIKGEIKMKEDCFSLES